MRVRQWLGVLVAALSIVFASPVHAAPGTVAKSPLKVKNITVTGIDAEEAAQVQRLIKETMQVQAFDPNGAVLAISAAWMPISDEKALVLKALAYDVTEMSDAKNVSAPDMIDKKIEDGARRFVQALLISLRFQATQHPK